MTRADPTCRNPAVVTPGSPHCCQHPRVTNPDPRLNHPYSNPFPSILLLFNLFFEIKGWGRSFIYQGTLKAAPREHPEPGLWCRCAKAQQEIIWSFSCTSARDNCTDSWEKAKQDAGMPSTHQGECDTCNLHRHLSGGAQPSQVLQEQNRNSALPNCFENLAGKSSLGDEELVSGKSTCSHPWNRGDSCRRQSPECPPHLAGGHQAPAPTDSHP